VHDFYWTEILAINLHGCLEPFFAQSFTAHAQNGHLSTPVQIFTSKFEIFVFRFLFDYEIWWHSRQDLCSARLERKTAFVMQNSQNLGARGVGDTHFGRDPQKAHPRQIPIV